MATSPEPLNPRTRPRRPRFRIAAGLLLAAALAAAGWWWTTAHQVPTVITGRGSVEASPVDVTTRVAGRVLRLVGREGAAVHAGAVLAELEPQEASAQVTQAQAAVVGAEAQFIQAQQALTAQQQVTSAQVVQAQGVVASAGAALPQSEVTLAIQQRTTREAVSAAQAQAASAEAQIGSTRSALVTARKTLARLKDLLAQGAVAASQVDAAQAAYEAADAQDRSAAAALAQARANLASAQANLKQVEIQQNKVDAARAQLAEARAGLRNAEAGYTVVAQREQDVAAARAALDQARANLQYVVVVAGHNTIVAPIDGVIQTKNVEVGEVLPPGAALYTMLNAQDLWLRIFVSEDLIGRVKVGQPARVTVDVLSGRTFTGTVAEIAGQPEFTTVNVQTKEDRVKLVFGVKIRLDNAGGVLRAGMPARAEIRVGGG